MQATADFLTDDIGLHNGTIREGMTGMKNALQMILETQAETLIDVLLVTCHTVSGANLIYV